MSGAVLLISVVSTLLFSLLVLIKLGVPVIVAGVLALVVGYVWWRVEQADDEERGWADYWCVFSDGKDIVKYVKQLF